MNFVGDSGVRGRGARVTGGRSRSVMALFLLLALVWVGCGNQQGPALTTKAFPKGAPQPLTYENVEILISDMDAFAAAVKKLDQQAIRTIDARYDGVQFEMDQPALFLNVYPDAAKTRVIFLLVPKEPKTGANYLLSFDKKLPVIDAYGVEAQMRYDNPEKQFICMMNVPDPVTYVQEYGSHTLVAHYVMKKRFFQSGTYDFDSLRFESYRSAGNAFIVFDPISIELKDTTANLTCTCK